MATYYPFHGSTALENRRIIGAVQQATVKVCLGGTLTLATIYTNATGAIARANPFLTDSLGRINFFAAPGIYDLYITGPDIDGTVLKEGVIIPDALPTYTAPAAGTLALAFGLNSCVKVTPNAAGAFTTTVPAAGMRRCLIILTSGVTTYAMTFGTGFLAQGTLNTGATSAKTWIVEFISDGANCIEIARSAAAM